MFLTKRLFFSLFIVALLLLIAIPNYGQKIDSTQNVYFLETWNYNKDKGDKVKMLAVYEKLKNDIFQSEDFIYIRKVKKGKIILISAHDKTLHIRDIQKFFQPYLIKTNIIEVIPINNSIIDISTIPIYDNEHKEGFSKKIILWEKNHPEVLESLIKLFPLIK